jgi:hypothetical protein
VPKQNRPVVRDGRLQVRKKRTDRSYLRPASGAPAVPTDVEETQAPPEDVAATPLGVSEAAMDAPAPVSAASSTARVPAAVRALQQQGTRRRVVDVESLLDADTRHARHELRRISILTTLSLVALIVLAVFLR